MRTDRNGHWTDTRLRGTACSETVFPSDECKALLVTDPVTGRLTISRGAPTHIDDSAYPQLYALAADRHGRPIVAFGR